MDLITLAAAKKLSGGSGLPTPTANDIGKVATVAGETSKGAVIVPEQTVDGGTEIHNANASLFTVGAICVTTYDGADYVGTVTEYKGSSRLIINDDTYLSLANNVISLNTFDVDSHTISVNLAQTTPAWGMSAPGGGVILVHSVNGTLDKTWQEIYTAMQNGIVELQYDNPPTVTIAVSAISDTKSSTYGVLFAADQVYIASSADGYPVEQ